MYLICILFCDREKPLQLTRFSDIGIRLLMYLAVKPRETPPATVAEVAAQFRVPRNHMVKVAGMLTKQGYITSIRGRSGGISLAQDPARIRIGTVLHLLENKDEVIACEHLQCGLNCGCGFRGALKNALDAFYESLNQYSLADVTTGAARNEIIRMQKSFDPSRIGFYTLTTQS